MPSRPGVPVFHAVRASTAEELQTLLARIIKRLMNRMHRDGAALRRYRMKFLTRKGFLIEEQGMSYLADSDPDLALGPLPVCSMWKLRRGRRNAACGHCRQPKGCRLGNGGTAAGGRLKPHPLSAPGPPAARSDTAATWYRVRRPGITCRRAGLPDWMATAMAFRARRCAEGRFSLRQAEPVPLFGRHQDALGAEPD